MLPQIVISPYSPTIYGNFLLILEPVFVILVWSLSFTCINLHLSMLMIFHIVIKWYLIVICTYYNRVLSPKKMAVCSDCGKSRSFNFTNMDNHANYLPLNIWLKNHWLSKYLLPLMKHNLPMRVNFSLYRYDRNLSYVQRRFKIK